MLHPLILEQNFKVTLSLMDNLQRFLGDSIHLWQALTYSSVITLNVPNYIISGDLCLMLLSCKGFSIEKDLENLRLSLCHVGHMSSTQERSLEILGSEYHIT